jgi:DNA-binding response OmpR family regulator
VIIPLEGMTATFGALRNEILVVEDYAPLREAIVRGLDRQGYGTISCADGAVGLDLALAHMPAVVVLDLMLPGLDGFEFLRRLRHAGSRARVLVLTARDALEDRVRGLDLGGDDYLVKPFAFDEFLARVRALRRRDDAAVRLCVGDLEVDQAACLAWRSGKLLDLTPKEYTLLACLIRQAGRPVPREEILREAFPKGGESNVVEVCVLSLRRKLEEGGRERLLHTRRGFGYVLESP